MGHITIFSLAIVLTIIGLSNANSYCQFTCPRMPVKDHVMCLHPRTGHSSECGRVLQGAISTAEKEEIVRMHNELRRKVASGLERRGNPGPQPAAKFMPDLKWDDELAKIAQRHADQCHYAHKCSTVDRFPVGQNIAWQSTYKSITDISVVQEVVNMWYNEVDLMDSRRVSSFADIRDPKKTIGHYTQMVWAETDKIGCGITKYSKARGRNMEVFTVCNYGRAGNFLGAKIYTPI